MAPHDLVLVIGLVTLAILQLVIHREGARRIVGRARAPQVPIAPLPASLREDVPARWPRA